MVREVDGYLRKSSAVTASSSGDGLGWDKKGLEVNPRIRFNHRGQIAAALPLKDSTRTDDESLMLRYQFFVTLDESPFLDGNHVIFGTVAGPTIFNVLRIGKTEVDEETGAPVDVVDSPPRIKSVKIDHHPFQDLVVTPERLLPWKKVDETSSGNNQSEMQKRRKKRKGKRDLNVLSFGDEERDYEDVVKDTSGGAIQSSHDVLHGESEVLSANVDADLKKKVEEDEQHVMPEKKKKRKLKTHDGIGDEKAKVEAFEESNVVVDESTAVVDKMINESITKQQEPVSTNEHDVNQTQHESRKPKKTKSIGAVEARRAKYLKNGHSTASKKERLKRENDTMAKLMAFRSKVLDTKGSSKTKPQNGSNNQAVDDSLASRMAKRIKDAKDEEAKAHKEEQDKIAAPGYHGQVDDEISENGDTAADTDWMGTKFKCKRHVDHDSRTSALEKGGDGRHMDDYLVLDEKRGGKSSHGKHRGSHSGHKPDHYRRRDDHRGR